MLLNNTERLLVCFIYQSEVYLNRTHLFVFPYLYIHALDFLKHIFKTIPQCMKCISYQSVYINYYFQLFTFILLACGDIEANPGPSFENVLDIVHLNIRSIRQEPGS
jgi:hypothetical protein